jgi:hypothetical protein
MLMIVRSHHALAARIWLAIGDLMGHPVPMTGQIPLSGGRDVEVDGRFGVVFERSLESEAFSRCQRGQFLDVERGIAKVWRRMLGSLDLPTAAEGLRQDGRPAAACRTLAEVKEIAQAVIANTQKPFDVMRLAVLILEIPRQYETEILKRWAEWGHRVLSQYAPYAAHVLTVEVFFQLALAAHLISSDRPSNRVDVAYLHYLPFCQLFVSSDKLHQRCAPLFLRDDQTFVWGLDLKSDLTRINQHYLTLPESDREKGMSAFARAPPNVEGSTVRALWNQYIGRTRGTHVEPPPPDDHRSQQLVEEIQRLIDAPARLLDDSTMREHEGLVLQRSVHKRRGSWWQMPKDLPDKPIKY